MGDSLKKGSAPLRRLVPLCTNQSLQDHPQDNRWLSRRPLPIAPEKKLSSRWCWICKRAPFFRATIYFEIFCSSRIPEKNAWDPWPPLSVGEKPGKAGPRGAETCGRKRRTPGKPKSSVKPGACEWEGQKYQAMVRNLAQRTESLWAANLFVTTSESIARPEDPFRLSSNQCGLRWPGRTDPSWQVLCAIKLQGVPKKFLIEPSFAVALQYLLHKESWAE